MFDLFLKVIPKALERAVKKSIFYLLGLFVNLNKKYPPGLPYKKILVLLPESALGDMLGKVALLTSLKASYTDAVLDVFVVRKNNKKVLEHNPLIRNIIFWETDRKYKLVYNLGLLWNGVKLRKEKYDLVVSPTSDNLRFAILARLAGSGRRTGFIDSSHKVKYADIFLSDAFDEKGMHFVEKHQKLAVYIAGERAKIKRPEMFLSKEEENYASSFWGKKGIMEQDILIGLHPLYGEYSERSYKADRFNKVINLMKEKNPALKFSIFWGPTEKAGMAELEKLALETGSFMIEDVDFRKLYALIKRLDLFICCNTGTSHLASMADVPVILLCDPKLFGFFDPWGKGGSVINTKTENCRDIEPGEIAEKAEKILTIDE
ncbi:MAG: hypothetical protein A2231_02220 [Candidatus Firestonebacteria bacterium RIFOXYA2_FULL_40_8]|nr:MAG: hypothetical protein A2231_02220 [Candidatus Firestonebacteria bacterium RIFOXYA2_FULL_40_8]